MRTSIRIVCRILTRKSDSTRILHNLKLKQICYAINSPISPFKGTFQNKYLFPSAVSSFFVKSGNIKRHIALGKEQIKFNFHNFRFCAILISKDQKYLKLQLDLKCIVNIFKFSSLCIFERFDWRVYRVKCTSVKTI